MTLDAVSFDTPVIQEFSGDEFSVGRWNRLAQAGHRHPVDIHRFPCLLNREDFPLQISDGIRLRS